MTRRPSAHCTSKTLSWRVQPGVRLVRASEWRCIIALSRLDLPTFERPAKATSAWSGGQRRRRRRRRRTPPHDLHDPCLPSYLRRGRSRALAPAALGPGLRGPPSLRGVLLAARSPPSCRTLVRARAAAAPSRDLLELRRPHPPGGRHERRARTPARPEHARERRTAAPPGPPGVTMRAAPHPATPATADATSVRAADRRERRARMVPMRQRRPTRRSTICTALDPATATLMPDVAHRAAEPERERDERDADRSR